MVASTLLIALVSVKKKNKRQNDNQRTYNNEKNKNHMDFAEEKKTSAELHSADKTKLKSLKYHFLMEAQIQQLNGQLLWRTRLPHCC